MLIVKVLGCYAGNKNKWDCSGNYGKSTEYRVLPTNRTSTKTRIRIIPVFRDDRESGYSRFVRGKGPRGKAPIKIYLKK